MGPHPTHSFGWYDPDERCPNCDCRPSYTSAEYPCGAIVPRTVNKHGVNVPVDYADFLAAGGVVEYR